MPKAIAPLFIKVLLVTLIPTMITGRAWAKALITMRQASQSRYVAIGAAMTFQEGDFVEIKTDNGSTELGTVKEVRGGGWYSIQMIQEQDSPFETSTQIQKFRASQLELSPLRMPLESTFSKAGSDQTIPSSSPDLSLRFPPPPTIYDLDEAVASNDPVHQPFDSAYLRQVAHHLSFSKWVVFTDLHCSPSTIDTCLEVLDFVHKTAVQHNAGILFLGDWWHHRGTIRVDNLNSILAALESWSQPMVMIPGNHDQITLGGHKHGLTPLQNAYRCPETQITGPLIFSHPTIFARALFVPHLRDNAVMESVLQSPASQQATAIFCHADVMGARMNDLILSQHGVLPDLFPPRIPIFSGHFHKPHVVKSSNTKSNDVNIEYVGSPYETSLAEAHQNKQLILLDSSNGWNTIERIPLSLGRRHFKADTVEELLSYQSMVRPGDRVIVTLSTEELKSSRRIHADQISDDNQLDTTIARLRKGGAAVEVREIRTIPSRAIGPGAFGANTRQLEELTPEVTLASFLEEEVIRSSIAELEAQELLKIGKQLLYELEENSDESKSPSIMKDIVLSSVTLEGFGPFKDRVTYPLRDRGLVLLRGTNKDGGSESNGTGKSSLAMATLWGLTGSIDPRLVSDARVADVVTDGCKMTKVSIQGTVNSQDFRIVRTKTASKTGLVFFLGETDLTTQSPRETQELLEENLGINLQVLSRTVFHGQHAVNGLLEASDVKLKEELTFIVPLELWQRAANLARSKARNATKLVTELAGMRKLREKDLMALQVRRDEAQAEMEMRRLQYEEQRLLAEELLERLTKESVPYDFASIEQEITSLNAEITKRQRDVQLLKQDREENLRLLNDLLDQQSQSASKARIIFREAQRSFDMASIRREIAIASRSGFDAKWQVESSSEMIPDISIRVCPTCLQTISEDESCGSHGEIRNSFKKEAENVMNEIQSAQEAYEKALNALAEARAVCDECEDSLSKASDDIVTFNHDSFMKITKTEEQLEEARSRHARYSGQMADEMSKMKNKLERQSIEAALEADEWSLQSTTERFYQLQEEFSRAEDSMKDMQSQAELQQSIASKMSTISDVFGTKGVQNFVLQNAIETLQTLSQAYLDELSDGSLRLSLCLDTGDKIERRAFVRLPDGDFCERPLASLSGGQWRRCALALSFGFVDLFSRRGRLRPSFLVMDEPLTHLDRTGRSLVGSLLRKLLVRGEQIGGIGVSGISASTIILILQDLAAEELEEAFDHVDEVVKSDGFSSVIIDERSI